jgi:hypothetical protein
MNLRIQARRASDYTAKFIPKKVFCEKIEKLEREVLGGF